MTTPKFTSDIDIDVANRAKALELFQHTPAGIKRDDKFVKHSTGVYFTSVPVNPFSDTASIDYREAEERGYVKLDLINMSVYEQVKSEEHLLELMKEPDWTLLDDKKFFDKVVHIKGHFNAMKTFIEPINSIPRMAMFLAAIRPSKKHLMGLEWKEVAKTIWEKPDDGSYYFKMAHALAYAQLVVVHMNLLSGK